MPAEVRPSSISPASPLSAVTLDGIAKSYHGQPVIRGLSLEVARGEFLAIVGPSGSGKTTLMRLVGGFEMPDAGRILLGGKDVTDVPAERRKVNTVFQSYALFPHMSVVENVAYGPRMRGFSRAARRARAGEMLDLVRLGDVAARRPHELSGGMQQRVALARALANEPDVLLLDEPLGALDRKLRDEMQRELRRVQGELGATFLYITHDQDEAFGMADRLAVMRAGRFEQVGAPAEVYDRPANAWVALFLGSGNAIPARATGTGPAATLDSALGPILSTNRAEPVASGARALVVVRPEATRFETGLPASGPNRITARITDVVAVGPSYRLRAVAGDGSAFEAVEPRTGLVPRFATGDSVTIAFDPAAARVYRDEAISPSNAEEQTS